MRSVIIGLAAAVAVVASGGPVAGELLFTAYDGESATDVNSNQTMGTRFLVLDVPLSVTRLGVYDDQHDGLLESHQVGVWHHISKELVGSAVVPAGSSAELVGDWRFVDVTPFTLASGEEYRIGAFTGDADLDRNPHRGTLTPNPAIQAPRVKNSYWDTGWGDPWRGDSTVRVFANADVLPVPEPSSIALLGIVSLGVVGHGRRRRRLRKRKA